MATLIEAALRVAKRYTEVYEGVATGGSTTTLLDTANKEEEAFWDDGVLWVLSGDNAGLWIDVLSWSNGTFTFKSAISSDVVAAGDKYAVVGQELSRNILRAAVSEACKSISKIYTSDATLTVVASQEEYTLPAGVSDVRRVEVAENTTSPYGYVVNPYWKENGGVLYFHPNYIPDQDAGNKIRIWYATVHPDMDDDDEMYWAVEDMQWAAMLYLLQHKLINQNKDDEWIVEMTNKAEDENKMAMRMLRRPPVRTPYLVGAF